MIQDNLNLKSENTGLRERMLELERELAELHRHFVETRERTEIRMRVLEDAISKLMAGQQSPASRSASAPPPPRPGPAPQGYPTQSAPPSYPPQGYAPQATPPYPPAGYPSQPSGALTLCRAALHRPAASTTQARFLGEIDGRVGAAGCRWQVCRWQVAKLHATCTHLQLATLQPATCNLQPATATCTPATCNLHLPRHQKIKFNSAAGVNVMPAAVLSAASSPTRS